MNTFGTFASNEIANLYMECAQRAKEYLKLFPNQQIVLKDSECQSEVIFDSDYNGTLEGINKISLVALKDNKEYILLNTDCDKSIYIAPIGIRPTEYFVSEYVVVTLLRLIEFEIYKSLKEGFINNQIKKFKKYV